MYVYMYTYMYVCMYTYMYVCICVYNGILAIKNNEILLFAATWMDLENVMLSEISQRKTNTL